MRGIIGRSRLPCFGTKVPAREFLIVVPAMGTVNNRHPRQLAKDCSRCCIVVPKENAREGLRIEPCSFLSLHVDMNRTSPRVKTIKV